MPKIPLTKGRFALVDAEDFDRLAKLKWAVNTQSGKTSYACKSIRIKGSRGIKKSLHMHRLIMNLKEGDKAQVDHINNNGLDNRKSNLRVCTISENRGNVKMRRDNKSGFKGVSWISRRKKWCSQIRKDNMRFVVGFFDTAEKAAKAYDKKALEIYGSFALTNKMMGFL